MIFDFSQLSGSDFLLGAFGATLVELYRLKRLLDKNDGHVRASRLQWLLSFVCFLFFIFGSGVLAATQGVSPEFSALYAGLTFPVFMSVILRDNAEAEKELTSKSKTNNREQLSDKNEIIKKLRRELYRVRSRAMANEPYDGPSILIDPDSVTNAVTRIDVEVIGRRKPKRSDIQYPDKRTEQVGRDIMQAGNDHTDSARWSPNIITTVASIVTALAAFSTTAVGLINIASKYLSEIEIAVAITLSFALLLVVPAVFVVKKSKRVQRFINGLF